MGPGHYHKMEPKPIAREPARPAGAGTMWPLGRRYSATLLVAPGSIRVWRRGRAPKIEADPGTVLALRSEQGSDRTR
jgi:hypothetical protein